MTAIHKANLFGRPVCGAEGRVRLSTSGGGVTCAACLPPRLEACACGRTTFDPEDAVACWICLAEETAIEREERRVDP